MAKYICVVCNHIYDEDIEGVKFEDLPDDYVCPLCGVPKSMFEEVYENEIINTEQEFSEEIVKNAIKISEDNVAIERINEICIECGICINTCKSREGINDICDGKACVGCGQCIQTCPTGALIPKSDKHKLYNALKEGKICIAYTSPSVRVAIGDEFGFEEGTFLQGKLVSALREIGFKYVLDVTFGADLTIVEEANEFVSRIKNNGVFPMFTSCCPSWIKYAEQYYPEILPNISTCKSPIGMQGEIVKDYFTMKNGIDKNDIFTVAITPCTAKKFEISREEIYGADCVITTLELISIIKEKGINFIELEDSKYDSLLGEGSGAGMIFGNTGGVMEAALRTAYNVITGKELEKNGLDFKNVRGIENIKEAELEIGDIKLNVAVINKMAAAKEVLEEVKNGTSKYHYIEIMNCLGGCIGGGGQPKIQSNKEVEVKEKRIKSLYERDKIRNIRTSHNNPDIKNLYNEYLERPLSKKAEELLHTKYKRREL